MAEKTFFVKRGWLIAKDSFGNMLPFFLHIRDKDIVWQSKYDSFLDRLTTLIEVNNITEEVPCKLVSFTSGIWTINLSYKTDKQILCTLKTAVKFNSNTFTLNANRDDLYANLNIPFALLDDYNFHIQCTLSTIGDQLSYSSTSVAKVSEFHDEKYIIRNAALHIKNQTYKFPTNYASNSEYTSSCVYVEISGIFADF